MSNYTVTKIGKCEVVIGDCIIHNEKMMTVCRGDILRNDFTGITIFGDSYNLGMRAVLKVEFIKAEQL